jgi:hypothetical protein
MYNILDAKRPPYREKSETYMLKSYTNTLEVEQLIEVLFYYHDLLWLKLQPRLGRGFLFLLSTRFVASVLLPKHNVFISTLRLFAASTAEESN